MKLSLADKLSSRTAGICLYGFAPPKQATPPDQLEAIVAEQLVRLGSLSVDGLIVYDIQDEADRVSTPRPFPFLPTLNPEAYADEHLGRLAVPKIIYRCVNRDTPDGFVRWLEDVNAAATPRISTLVGAPSNRFARRPFFGGRVYAGAAARSEPSSWRHSHRRAARAKT